MKYRQTLRVLGLTLVLGTTAWAQDTRRVSVSSAGTQGNGSSDYPSISADGLSVAFRSYASNLNYGDTNGVSDVFYRAWQNNYTEIVSVNSSAAEGNAGSHSASISADGRYVAFESTATNLVPGDTNGRQDIFVRNRSSGATERVSISSSGVEGNRDSYSPSISADGRYVAFASNAYNLVDVDSNFARDVFVRDRLNGTTERVSVNRYREQGNRDSGAPSISANGSLVAFASDANNLVLYGDINGKTDVFVRDRVYATTTLVSVSSVGVLGNGDSYAPSISADGLSVAFLSSASNLITWDTNGVPDVYYRAWLNNYTEIVSVDSSAALGNGICGAPSISADGRCVAFASSATNLVSGDTNGCGDIFVRNRSHGTTERVSISSSGLQGNSYSYSPSISADGRYVAFASYANLVSGDTNGVADVFIRDRGATP